MSDSVTPLPSSDLPAGSVFLPINCTSQRASAASSYFGRPLLALIDAARFDELDPIQWLTAATAAEARSSVVFRLVRSRSTLTASGKSRAIREKLAARVLNVHQEPDDKVAYRNGDRLDCRAANLVMRRDCAALGLDPDLLVAPGSTFSGTNAFHRAYAQRMASRDELARRHAPGRKPTLTLDQVREVLETVRDQPWAQNQSYGWFRDEFFALPDTPWSGAILSAATIRGILKGEQQRVPGFDYESIRQYLPDLRAKRIRDLRDFYQ
jgi:hypothetical protein